VLDPPDVASVASSKHLRLAAIPSHLVDGSLH
jgi:hypothetical protein